MAFYIYLQKDTLVVDWESSTETRVVLTILSQGRHRMVELTHPCDPNCTLLVKEGTMAGKPIEHWRSFHGPQYRKDEVILVDVALGPL